MKDRDLVVCILLLLNIFITNCNIHNGLSDIDYSINKIAKGLENKK